MPFLTCEGCHDPATCEDSTGTPLCDACYDALPFADEPEPEPDPLPNDPRDW